MTKEKMVDCPACGGGGSWMDFTPNYNSRASCPPERTCPFCRGACEVPDWVAAEYDPNTNYEEERRQEEADMRGEAKRDRLLGL